jgi:N-acetylglucosaminyldiphosphoundecaprenol N-acetyl-beta-D-mannosaminyltransferase
MLARLQQAKPEIILVALGCPRQEKWMAQHRDKLNACMLGIGAALPVFAGMQSRAPGWMQEAGLEWLYRLVREPRRLWKRYVSTNSLFIFLLVKALLRRQKTFTTACKPVKEVDQDGIANERAWP